LPISRFVVQREPSEVSVISQVLSALPILVCLSTLFKKAYFIRNYEIKPSGDGTFTQLNPKKGLAHADLPNFPGPRAIDRLQHRGPESCFFAAATSGNDRTTTGLHAGRLAALQRTHTGRRSNRRVLAAKHPSAQRTMSRGV